MDAARVTNDSGWFIVDGEVSEGGNARTVFDPATVAGNSTGERCVVHWSGGLTGWE
jgi:hypothetical protein